MSDTPVNNSKRTWIIASGCAGAVGGIAAAVPFVSSMMPSEKAKAAGAAVEADISGLKPGEKLTVEWRGKPVWIVRRTPEQLAALPKLDPQLADPQSLRKPEETPEYARNGWRSRKPEVFVVVGICTHLGCIPQGQKVGEVKGDYNGWFCPCHGSAYDTSGRIRKGPAPLNLPVPPYQFVSDTSIKIG